MEYESLFKAARQAGTLLAETETERLGRTLMHAAQLLRTHTPACSKPTPATSKPWPPTRRCATVCG